MADKNRTFATPATNSKFKRPATSTAGTRKFVPASALKDHKDKTQRLKVNKNDTVIGENDLTMRQDCMLPDFDSVNRQIAYGDFLRAMLEECLVDEKIQLEETEIDIQMAQLANRFKNTMDQLDKTSRRVKDISFVVEQERLLDLKSQDCSKFYKMTEQSNVQEIVNNLTSAEQSCLDKLETKNVDFGYSKESGHQQLLDAVNEAIKGLDEIKKHSNLDLQKFKEYAQSETNIKEMEKERFDLESLKAEFDEKYPKFSEKLLKEASERIALMMKSDDEDVDISDESDDD